MCSKHTQIYIAHIIIIFNIIENLNLQQVDAQEFYTNEEIRLTALIEEEKKVVLSKPLGVAFITLGISFNIYNAFF